MKRRICLAGVALSAGPLALGVGPALAVKSQPANSKGKPVATSTCRTNVGIMIPAGETGVTPPATSGHEYGTAACGKVFGRGAQSDAFHVADTGDTFAPFTLFFRAGTIHGKYHLTIDSNSFNFLVTDYAGTMTVAGGTGAFQGAKGTGTMTCHSPDGIHTACTDKLKMKAL